MAEVLHSEDGSKLEVGTRTPKLENEINGEEVEYLNVAGPLLPLLAQQGPQEGKEKGEVLWVAEFQRATEYLNLLYDLAISSVLSVFGNNHHILNGASIAAYFSYFLIIWWVWASQVVYDSRFQANDWIHRLFKFLQLGAFTYIGVFAQNFDPSNVIAPPDSSSSSSIAQYQSAKAWKGAAIAYALSRLLLSFQYFYVALITQAPERRKRWDSFVIPIVTTLLSATFWLISGLLTLSSAAKLVLGYGGLVIEVVVTIAASTRESAIAPSSGMLGGRFADLTLVILAEGVLSIVTTLAEVVSGFGLNSGGSKLNGYSECISSLVVVFGTWHFIFHAFDHEQRFRNRRTSLVWAFLHLPLHFVILLLLLSLNGVAVYGNIDGGVTVLTNDFVQFLDQVGLVSTSSLDGLLTNNVLLQFNKLGLSPPVKDELDRVNQQAINLDFYINTTGVPPPAFDPFVEQLTYFSYVMWTAAQSYSINLGPNTTDLYNQLSATSSDWNGTDQDMVNLETSTNTTYMQFCFSYTVDIAAPAQLFLPSAGALIILAALLTVFRTYGIPDEEEKTSQLWDVSGQIRSIGRADIIPIYPKLARAPRKWQVVVAVWDWLPFTLHMIVGIVLCVLAALDIPLNLLSSPIDSLLNVGWVLPLVAISYGGLMVLDCIVLVLARKARGGRFIHRIHEKEE
ncbi:hypothetical protein DACRYDRAFT_89007 [Dacryopinax primogenitus]|uniref:Low temperature requirement A n=1 Tax=Dacryopinax primogenitus (strain DJM 731) TaxID=1858805 RepID=M5G7V8_DACPD|nr:uncharacterized protein DACRYDRAFT_89007 [Dacryopinax primogenitus]EJU01967.1 hypothetical protein DACRYDRAFT_89007 [Dacryopinax primogenitus]